MHLTPREQDKLMVVVAADLARRRGRESPVEREKLRISPTLARRAPDRTHVGDFGGRGGRRARRVAGRR